MRQKTIKVKQEVQGTQTLGHKMTEPKQQREERESEGGKRAREQTNRHAQTSLEKPADTQHEDMTDLIGEDIQKQHYAKQNTKGNRLKEQETKNKKNKQ